MKLLNAHIYLLPAAVAVSGAYAEVCLGQSGALAFGLESGIRHTDNVTLSSDEESDTVISLLPTLNYRSDAGAASIDAVIGVESLTYSELDSNDAENFKSSIRVAFPDEREGENFSFVFEGGYNETTSARSSLQSVVQTEETDLALKTRYYINDYTTLRTSVEHADSVSQTENFADVTTLTIPVALYLELDEALSAGIGYRYRSTELGKITSDRADSTDQAFYFGLENERSSVWGYALEIGIQSRDFDQNVDFGDESGLFASLAASWQLSAMTELVAEIGNEYGTTLANQSTETSGIALQLNHSYDDRLSASFGLSVEQIEYVQENGSTREDDRFSSYVNVDYKLKDEKWYLRASVSYDDNSSDFARANYSALSTGISSVFLY